MHKYHQVLGRLHIQLFDRGRPTRFWNRSLDNRMTKGSTRTEGSWLISWICLRRPMLSIVQILWFDVQPITTIQCVLGEAGIVSTISGVRYIYVRGRNEEGQQFFTCQGRSCAALKVVLSFFFVLHQLECPGKFNEATDCCADPTGSPGAPQRERKAEANPFPNANRCGFRDLRSRPSLPVIVAVVDSSHSSTHPAVCIGSEMFLFVICDRIVPELNHGYISLHSKVEGRMLCVGILALRKRHLEVGRFISYGTPSDRMYYIMWSPVGNEDKMRLTIPPNWE
ncbi:hypothetical protein EDD17DRAFT_194853 [Pisolithus thermaeus]|nr:hypothetical protein EDD17DRAFT_194853 [Pisolithus thermaeus]